MPAGVFDLGRGIKMGVVAGRLDGGAQLIDGQRRVADHLGAFGG